MEQLEADKKIKELLQNWLKNENNSISGNNFKETMDNVHEIYNTWQIENKFSNTQFKLKQLI